MEKINPSGPRRIYKPVGRCIYCGAEGNLGKEHIIPLGLGGNFVLPKASCTPCSRLTNSFEQPLLRGAFFPARVHLGFPTRGKDPRPDAFPVKLKDGRVIRTALRDHPCLLHMMPFRSAMKVLTGEPVNGQISVGLSVYVWQPDFGERIARIGGQPMTIAPEAEFGHFLRLLAKVGHSFAVAERGVDGFDPTLLKVIRGDAGTADEFIGGTDEGREPTRDFHQLWLTEHEVGARRLLVTNIRLFANLEGPVHQVGVGWL